MRMSVLNGLRRIDAKKVVLAAGFVAAMVTAIGLGLAVKQSSQAAVVRDCSTNSINYVSMNGGCGSADAKEFIKDVRANNPSDLQTIYAHFGLSPSEYDRFERTARMGTAYKDGRVVVDGQTVLTNAHSMGRHTFEGQRSKIVIGGKTYYYSPNSASFRSASLPVLVMFDSKGVVETAVISACGNPTWGNKVVPEYDCKTLNMKSVGKNSYEFTTSVHYKNNATVNKVVYDFGDGSPTVTETDPNKPVRHTYTKPGKHTAKVTVYFNLPGKQVVAVPAVKCVKEVTVVQPYYACTLLQAAPLNSEKTRFRFTVKASYGNGATLKSADFTLDGTSTVTGVTTKDADGNIYRDYTFAQDGKTHTVVAKVNFNVDGGVQSKTCEAKVKAGEAPKCPLPGKGHLPPDSPECVENCPIPGKEDLPKDSPECVEIPPELPKTGMGGVLGLFAGTSVIGTIAHRVITNRRIRD